MTMKGNQGLEALAALCGGRPKVIDMVGNSVLAANAQGSGSTTPSSHRASPNTIVSSAPAGKTPSPVGIVGAAATTNQILIRQATERKIAETASLANAISGGNSSVSSHQQQHQQQQQPAVCAAAPISTDIMAAPGMATGPAALVNLTPQQISQAILAAANSQGGRLDPALAQSLLFPAALRGTPEALAPSASVPEVPASTNNILANTMQQLMIQQYLQAQASAQQHHVQQQQQAQAQAAAASAVAATVGHPQAALLAMTLAAGKTGQPQQHFLPTATPAPIKSTTTTTASDLHRSSHASSGAQHQQQQAQAAQAQAMLQHAAKQQQLNTAGFTAIKPSKSVMHPHAQAIQQQYHFPNGTPAAAGANANNIPSMIKIASAGGRILPSTELPPQNSLPVRSSSSMKDSSSTTSSQCIGGNKKQQKRAANRRSAQLSRKRKKQFIEELKDENDDLRRKEQILRAIPDLIVVFDSSGRLGFVSESVGRFLDICPEDLEGSSFWDLICEESVRMLKAAFMDSLAAREVDSDMALLGSGVWELRLKDKNSKYMLVTLNGVVHFKGDAPECVCCIRPLGDEQQQITKQMEQQQQSTLKKEGLGDDNNTESGNKSNKNVNRAVSCSDGDASRTSDGSNRTQQSVLNNRISISSAQQDDSANDAKKRNKKFRRLMASSEDGDNQNSNNNNINNLEADGTNNSVRISDGDSNDGIESDWSGK